MQSRIMQETSALAVGVAQLLIFFLLVPDLLILLFNPFPIRKESRGPFDLNVIDDIDQSKKHIKQNVNGSLSRDKETVDIYE